MDVCLPRERETEGIREGEKKGWLVGWLVCGWVGGLKGKRREGGREKRETEGES